MFEFLDLRELRDDLEPPDLTDSLSESIANLTVKEKIKSFRVYRKKLIREKHYSYLRRIKLPNNYNKSAKPWPSFKFNLQENHLMKCMTFNKSFTFLGMILMSLKLTLIVALNCKKLDWEYMVYFLFLSNFILKK